MSDYKRFVSYIYGYKQGEKGESTGFVKVNARGGECRIWVHVRGFYTHHQEPYRVYAFKQKKEGLEGQYLGELESRNGALEWDGVTKTDSLMGGFSMDKLDEAKVKATAEKYSDNIVGLKARASQSVVGEMGLTPIAEAARIAHEIEKPLMIHVGNYPPALMDVLKLVDEGDIITHAYHGKKGGILTEEGEIIQEAKDARARGVRFDVGHGVASFSLRVYKQALLDNFDCDMISTDLHVENYNGPVYNIASVMSKLINCGESLDQVVHKVTYVPAKHYGLEGLGELREGCTADLNLLTLDACEEEIADSIGDTIILKNKITVRKTIYSKGEESEVFRKSIGNE